MFMRAHPNHLFPEPSESRCQQCAKYFPGIDFILMHDWWVYVEEGGSIAAEDVAYAIQYAVIYQFLKYASHLETRDAARAYVEYGVKLEAEYINAHKGQSDVLLV
ncbi:hypothetical protein QFC21_003469 [Naganishia friedmannii]|uniref:Uncharacterized protein n=1 Tax=Naganishia friedmannii TaxID=89922 RepID=A0ACC2VQU2_9TREE|nr:hypothetical protein QFC21_003469 [Naganishia friedmannii]